jgi:hypothetical protein
MHVRFIAWLILIGLFGASVCCGDSPGTPVDQFYNLYLKLHPSGLPTQAEEEALAPYLSKRLLRLVDTARSCQDAFIRKHPGDKPPWADGCLFASLFEGPTQFKIAKVVANPDGASTVYVHFGNGPAEWEDSVIVIREAGRHVIYDFVMSGAGPFNPPGRFSEGLKCPSE